MNGDSIIILSTSRVLFKGDEQTRTAAYSKAMKNMATYGGRIWKKEQDTTTGEIMVEVLFEDETFKNMWEQSLK